MAQRCVIKGGCLALPSGEQRGDLVLEGGKIAAIGLDLPTDGATVIDASGLVVTPGGVDPHCHIEQISGMGLKNADTWESATRAALHGGTTSLIAFAAQARGQPLAEALAAYLALAERGAMADYAVHLSICDPEVPRFHEDLAEAVAAGHRSIKVFTTYNIKLEDRQILDIMATARRAGGLVCVHAENDGMIGWAKAALLASGQAAPAAHALSHPRLAEVEAIDRICRFAEYLGQPVMIFHVSTAEGAAAVRAARGRGVPVTAETCPHYLFQTADVLNRPEGAKWMCSPPQREKADQAALWRALDLGDLALVSSDHAPYRYDATGKLAAGEGASFDRIANGMPGLEPRLPLLFDALVAEDGTGAARFAELVAGAPARIYGLPGKGMLAPGADGDLVLWDPTVTRTYGVDDLHDNVGYNPWDGRRLRGGIVHVLRRGAVVVENGMLVARPGSGQWMPRPVGPRPAVPAPEAHATGAF